MTQREIMLKKIGTYKFAMKDLELYLDTHPGDEVALNKFEDGTVITAELLKQNNIIGKIEKDGLKVLGNGTLQKNLNVKANKFTATAIEKIKQAGGTIEVL